MKKFVATLFCGALLSVSVPAQAEHYLHRQIDACDFANDTRCAQAVLHQVLELALSAGPVQLRGGLYQPYADNPAAFCPQQVVPQFEQGNLTKATLTYVSPCTGVVDEFTCSGNYCTGTNGNFTVLSSTSYSFTNVSSQTQEFRLNGGALVESVATGKSVTNF